MVYDITNRKTYDEIKAYWYNEIKNLCDQDISMYSK